MSIEIGGAIEKEIRAAWEETPETAAQIASRYEGITKNMIISHARRYGWESFTPGHDRHTPPRTMEDRLKEVWDRFNQKLAECKKTRSHYTPAGKASSAYRI